MHVWRGCILTGKPAFLASFTALEFRCFVYGCMKKFSDPAATYSSTVHWIARVCIIWYLHTSVIFGYFRLHPHRVDTLSRCSSLLYLRLFRYHFHAFHWIYHPVPLYPPPPSVLHLTRCSGVRSFRLRYSYFLLFFQFSSFFLFFSLALLFTCGIRGGGGGWGNGVQNLCAKCGKRRIDIPFFFFAATGLLQDFEMCTIFTTTGCRTNEFRKTKYRRLFYEVEERWEERRHL